MAMKCIQGSTQIPGKKSLGALEKISFRYVGSQFCHVVFFNRQTIANKRSELPHLFYQQARVCAYPSQEQRKRVRGENNSKIFCFRQNDLPQTKSASFVVSANNGEIRFLLAPLTKPS